MCEIHLVSLLVLVFVSATTGLRLYDKCTDHHQCPAHSSCRPYDCSGYSCLCDEGFVATDDKTKCLTARLVGEQCSFDDTICMSPFAFCLGHCECMGVFQTTQDGRCKLPGMGFTGDKCDELSPCHPPAACVNDVCVCEPPYRQLTTTEFWVDPMHPRQCVTESYSLDKCNGTYIPIPQPLRPTTTSTSTSSTVTSTSTTPSTTTTSSTTTSTPSTTTTTTTTTTPPPPTTTVKPSTARPTTKAARTTTKIPTTTKTITTNGEETTTRRPVMQTIQTKTLLTMLSGKTSSTIHTTFSTIAKTPRTSASVLKTTDPIITTNVLHEISTTPAQVVEKQKDQNPWNQLISNNEVATERPQVASFNFSNIDFRIFNNDNLSSTATLNLSLNNSNKRPPDDAARKVTPLDKIAVPINPSQTLKSESTLTSLSNELHLSSSFVSLLSSSLAPMSASSKVSIDTNLISTSVVDYYGNKEHPAPTLPVTTVIAETSTVVEPTPSVITHHGIKPSKSFVNIYTAIINQEEKMKSNDRDISTAKTTASTTKVQQTTVTKEVATSELEPTTTETAEPSTTKVIPTTTVVEETSPETETSPTTTESQTQPQYPNTHEMVTPPPPPQLTTGATARPLTLFPTLPSEKNFSDEPTEKTSVDETKGSLPETPIFHIFSRDSSRSVPAKESLLILRDTPAVDKSKFLLHGPTTTMPKVEKTTENNIRNNFVVVSTTVQKSSKTTPPSVDPQSHIFFSRQPIIPVAVTLFDIGRPLHSTCTHHKQCPEHASCRPNSCKGYTCLCDEGYIASEDNKFCLRAIRNGERCDPRTDKCLSKFSMCAGVCKCLEFFEHTRDGRCKLPDVGYVGDKCTNGGCSYPLKCVDGRCQCVDPFRELTPEEFWVSPQSTLQCRMKTSSLDKCNGSNIPIPESLRPNTTTEGGEGNVESLFNLLQPSFSDTVSITGDLNSDLTPINTFKTINYDISDTNTLYSSFEANDTQFSAGDFSLFTKLLYAPNIDTEYANDAIDKKQMPTELNFTHSLFSLNYSELHYPTSVSLVNIGPFLNISQNISMLKSTATYENLLNEHNMLFLETSEKVNISLKDGPIVQRSFYSSSLLQIIRLNQENTSSRTHLTFTSQALGISSSSLSTKQLPRHTGNSFSTYPYTLYVDTGQTVSVISPVSRIYTDNEHNNNYKTILSNKFMSTLTDNTDIFVTATLVGNEKSITTPSLPLFDSQNSRNVFSGDQITDKLHSPHTFEQLHHLTATLSPSSSTSLLRMISKTKTKYLNLDSVFTPTNSYILTGSSGRSLVDKFKTVLSDNAYVTIKTVEKDLRFVRYNPSSVEIVPDIQTTLASSNVKLIKPTITRDFNYTNASMDREKTSQFRILSFDNLTMNSGLSIYHLNVDEVERVRKHSLSLESQSSHNGKPAFLDKSLLKSDRAKQDENHSNIYSESVYKMSQSKLNDFPSTKVENSLNTETVTLSNLTKRPSTYSISEDFSEYSMLRHSIESTRTQSAILDESATSLPHQISVDKIITPSLLPSFGDSSLSRRLGALLDILDDSTPQLDYFENQNSVSITEREVEDQISMTLTGNKTNIVISPSEQVTTINDAMMPLQSIIQRPKFNSQDTTIILPNTDIEGITVFSDNDQHTVMFNSQAQFKRTTVTLSSKTILQHLTTAEAILPTPSKSVTTIFSSKFPNILFVSDRGSTVIDRKNTENTTFKGQENASSNFPFWSLPNDTSSNYAKSAQTVLTITPSQTIIMTDSYITSKINENKHDDLITNIHKVVSKIVKPSTFDISEANRLTKEVPLSKFAKSIKSGLHMRSDFEIKKSAIVHGTMPNDLELRSNPSSTIHVSTRMTALDEKTDEIAFSVYPYSAAHHEQLLSSFVIENDQNIKEISPSVVFHPNVVIKQQQQQQQQQQHSTEPSYVVADYERINSSYNHNLSRLISSKRLRNHFSRKSKNMLAKHSSQLENEIKPTLAFPIVLKTSSVNELYEKDNIEEKTISSGSEITTPLNIDPKLPEADFPAERPSHVEQGGGGFDQLILPLSIVGVFLVNVVAAVIVLICRRKRRSDRLRKGVAEDTKKKFTEENSTKNRFKIPRPSVYPPDYSNIVDNSSDSSTYYNYINTGFSSFHDENNIYEEVDKKVLKGSL